MTQESEKYESISMILRTPAPNGDSWFDYLFDVITEHCEGTGEEDEDGNYESCTCGLETMGGMQGTIEQVGKHLTSVGSGLQPIDLARTIMAYYNDGQMETELFNKVIKWAESEIRFEEEYPDAWEEDSTDS